MPQLPRELERRFGVYRFAWVIPWMNGYVTHEQEGRSDWYIFWLLLENRWEYLPFGALEAGEGSQWTPLVGVLEAVAGAIGRSQVLYLVVEREVVEELGET